MLRVSDLRRELQPTLEAIDKLCVEFQVWREAACAEVDAFAAELLLREALTNSVVHGCSGDLHKRICCVFRAKRGRLLIGVQDQGTGFDWRARWDLQAEPTDTHGRGIEIFRRYAEAVRFNSKGNSVMLIKRFREVSGKRGNF